MWGSFISATQGDAPTKVNGLYLARSLPHLHSAPAMPVHAIIPSQKWQHSSVNEQEHLTHLSQKTEESNHAHATSGRIRRGRSILDRWWGVPGVSDQGAGFDEWRVGRVGDEEVPAVHASIRNPSPQKCEA